MGGVPAQERGVLTWGCTWSGGVPGLGGLYLSRGYLPGGCTCLEGCTCSRGCTYLGMYLPGGVPVWGEVPAQGLYMSGGVPAQEVYLPGGVPGPGGYLPRYSPL